ncbi:hypothetical protein AX14_007499 [Amanita brunnescens Koide BX004]|nr:hypothetical protein AX14_007499 [Amanita brunnescens Koide BX004]
MMLNWIVKALELPTHISGEMIVITRVSSVLTRMITSSGQELWPGSEGTDARITRILGSAYNCYDECDATISSAYRDVAASRHLFNLATTVIELARRADNAPHTNFMQDIAINVLK